MLVLLVSSGVMKCSLKNDYFKVSVTFRFESCYVRYEMESSDFILCIAFYFLRQGVMSPRLTSIT